MSQNTSTPAIVIQSHGMKFDADFQNHVKEKTGHLDRFGNNIVELKVEFTHNTDLFFPHQDALSAALIYSCEISRQNRSRKNRPGCFALTRRPRFTGIGMRGKTARAGCRPR